MPVVIAVEEARSNRRNKKVAKQALQA